MRFDYAYRDSNNERHDGQVVASSRDEAFKLLRAQGVKPFFVAPSKGFGNWLLSFGKRGLAIAILSVVSIVAVTIALSLGRTVAEADAERTAPMTRRQVYGDPALMERLQMENYASLFAEPGDRVLVHFAQPALMDRYVIKLIQDPSARAAAITNLASLVTIQQSNNPTIKQFSLAHHSPNPTLRSNSSSPTRETTELIRIVRWLRDEYTAYLANGNGTPESYLTRLLERQTYEAQLLARYRREMEGVTDLSVWEQRNNELRAIGAPTLPMPDSAEDH